MGAAVEMHVVKFAADSRRGSLVASWPRMALWPVTAWITAVGGIVACVALWPRQRLM